jgi:hypothetical protein
MNCRDRLKVKSKDCRFAAYQNVATFQVCTAVWLRSEGMLARVCSLLLTFREGVSVPCSKFKNNFRRLLDP